MVRQVLFMYLFLFGVGGVASQGWDREIHAGGLLKPFNGEVTTEIPHAKRSRRILKRSVDVSGKEAVSKVTDAVSPEKDIAGEGSRILVRRYVFASCL